MPSGRVSASMEGRRITRAPNLKIGKITAIHINNRSTSNVQVNLEDRFTLVTGASMAVTKIGFVTVGAGKDLHIIYSEPAMEFIGELYAVANADEGDCEIVVEWRWE